MSQADFFDGTESARLKLEGMDLAALNGSQILATARQISLEMTGLGGEITSDMVFREMRARGLPSCIGPAAGSLFKTSHWMFTGRRVRSNRTTNHAREIKVWRRVR